MNLRLFHVTLIESRSVFLMVRTCAVLVLACVFSVASAAQPDSVPQGWHKAGNAPQEYDVGTDASVRRSGSASAYVKSRVAAPRGFGTLMQSFAADEYRGKRVRLSGYLRAVGVKGNAGAWMRVDGPERERPLGFDNTQPRVTPTGEWARFEIVLDVPMEATTINFGFLLSGEGQVWVDDLDFEEVGRDVPVTGRGAKLPTRPRNLDFERKPPPPTTSHVR